MSHPKISKEMKAMALAILMDEYDEAVVAGLALRDTLEETKDAVPVSPIKTIAEARNLRVVAFIEEDMTPTTEELQQIQKGIVDWIEDGSTNPLIMFGVSRIEMYEIKGLPDEEVTIGRKIDAHPNMSDQELSPEEKQEIDLGKVYDTRDPYDGPGACYRG